MKFRVLIFVFEYVFSFEFGRLVTKCSSSSPLITDIILSCAQEQESVNFVVIGEPTPLQRHRTLKCGKNYNPSSKAQADFAKSCEMFMPEVPLVGPLDVSIDFYFTRPKYHYRTGKYSHLLKIDADTWHSNRPGAVS